MSDSTTLQSPARSVPLFSISRVWTLAISTLTQLIRMKTFYFLFAFAVLLLVVGNFNFASSPAQALSTVKKVSFGAMDLFAWLFAIVATALLIPRDIEDRTLYTILSKPVRRIEYLLGKLCGVLIVIGISLTVMFFVCAGMIQWQEMGYIAEEVGLSEGQITDETRQAILLIEKNGFHPTGKPSVFRPAPFIRSLLAYPHRNKGDDQWQSTDKSPALTTTPSPAGWLR